MNAVLRIFLAVIIVSASVLWALLSLIVLLEGFEDGRAIMLAGYQLDAELAGALGLLISGVGVVAAARILRSYGHPRLVNRRPEPH